MNEPIKVNKNGSILEVTIDRPKANAIDKKTMIVCHWLIIFINGTYINLIKTDNAAILGIKAKKLVTEVGEPSYTSGVHIWKGTADTLKAKATIIKTIPNTAPVLELSKFSEIISKLVEPVNPYIREQP